MFQIQEKMAAATRDSFEKQNDVFSALAVKTFESIEKLASLNLNAARTSMEESSVMTRRLLAAKDTHEMFSLMSALAWPSAEKALFYGRHLANIAADAQAEFTKATEAQVAEVNSQMASMADAAGKNAPAGSGNIAAIIQSAIEVTNAGYEQMSRTKKQAFEAVEASLNNVVDQFAKPSSRTSETVQ